jgi:hypothetical protein
MIVEPTKRERATILWCYDDGEAGRQRQIVKGEQSGLLTRIATEIVSLRPRMKSGRRLWNWNPATRGLPPSPFCDALELR